MVASLGSLSRLGPAPCRWLLLARWCSSVLVLFWLADGAAATAFQTLDQSQPAWLLVASAVGAYVSVAGFGLAAGNVPPAEEDEPAATTAQPAA